MNKRLHTLTATLLLAAPTLSACGEDRDDDMDSPVRRQLEEELRNGPEFPLRPNLDAPQFDDFDEFGGEFGGPPF